VAEWQVFASPIKLISHPNAENLMIAKVGNYSLVVAKTNGYNDGDIVVLAPDKSILPDEIKGNYVNTDTGISYLIGPEHNRVKRIRLRGEDSDGCTIRKEWVMEKLGLSNESEIPLNIDLSEKLNITKYEPPISFSMGGTLSGNFVQLKYIQFQKHHDCEKLRLYVDEFSPGETVIVTEKVHGSQVSIMKSSNNVWYVTSKGIGRKEVGIEESESNLYWRALHVSGIEKILEEKFASSEFQVFGEVVPCQKGYTYGQNEPTLLIFRAFHDNKELNWDDLVEIFGELRLVPLVYKGPFSEEKMIELSKGMEQVSGKNLHIREGVVVSPEEPRKSKEGFPLYIKVINPKYKESGEEFS